MTLERGNGEQRWKIEDPLHKQLYEKAEPFLQVRNNAIHTRASYQYALRLLEKEGGDPEVVLPAILLHDIGYSKIPEEELRFAFIPKIIKPELRKLHEVEGARLAGEILQSINYPEGYIPSIQALIDGHDTRGSALNVNDKLVQDADKLFRFTYEGCVFASKYMQLDPWKFLNRLERKAQTWFFTATGKQIAVQELEKRRIDFLDPLYENRTAPTCDT
jgi:hypothetical protein